MIWRILASFAFVVGGVLMWFVLAGLRGFATMQAGMSAVSVAGPPSSEALIPWFVCSYFAVSAVGVLVFKRRSGLMSVAAVAHLMALVAFCLLCSEGSQDSRKFIGEALILGLLTLLVFSPWLCIWCSLLFAGRRDDAI